MRTTYLAPLAAAALVAGWGASQGATSVYAAPAAPGSGTSASAPPTSAAAEGTHPVHMAALQKALGGAGTNPGATRVVDVAAYGAKGDGTTDDTAPSSAPSTPPAPATD